MRDKEEEYDRSVVCLFCFCMSYMELSTSPAHLFTIRFPLPFSSFTFSASLEKGGGLPQASRRDFLKKAFQKKVHYFLIPQSTHFVRSQLPLQGSLLIFPHTLFDGAWKRLQCNFGSRKRHLCKKSAVFYPNIEISADWRIINTPIIYFDGVIINILCICLFSPHRCIRHFFKFSAVWVNKFK